MKHPYGSKEFIHFLIESGSNVNELDSEGCTPLFWALRGRYSMRSRFPNNDEIIHELVTAGATVTAIDEDGDTPLHDVPNVKIAKMFLQHGADALAKNKDGKTPIHTASARGDMDVVNLLLENGAYLDEADAIGQTPLILAAGSDLDLLRLLLDRGASVNARTDAGWTALYYAIRSLSPSCVKLLLSKGADANSRLDKPFGVHNTTPLHYATVISRSGYSSAPIILALLDHGADLEAKDSDGATPLLRAIATDGTKPTQKEVVRLLVERGANMDAKQNDGQGVADLAKARGFRFSGGLFEEIPRPPSNFFGPPPPFMVTGRGVTKYN